MLSGIVLHIMILFTLGKEEDKGENECENFRNRDCPPNAVHAEKYRKDKNRRGLKDQRSHKRYRCRNRTVVKRSEKR